MKKTRHIYDKDNANNKISVPSVRAMRERCEMVADIK